MSSNPNFFVKRLFCKYVEEGGMRIRHASFTPVRMMSACHGVPSRRTLMSTRKIVVKDTLLLRYTHSCITSSQYIVLYSTQTHICSSEHEREEKEKWQHRPLYLANSFLYHLASKWTKSVATVVVASKQTKWGATLWFAIPRQRRPRSFK